jgi:hypothetical protein
MRNPWINLSLGGVRKEILLSHEQLELLPQFDAVKLREVIAWYGTQEHVRTAARERLALLTRAGFNSRPSRGLDRLKATVKS